MQRKNNVINVKEWRWILIRGKTRTMKKIIKGKLKVEGGIISRITIKLKNGNDKDLITFIEEFHGEEIELTIKTCKNSKANKK